MPLTLALIASSAELAQWTPAWRFERSLWLTQPWRLVTAHMVHLGWTHLLLNLLALALLAWCFPPRVSPARWLRAWLISSLAVSGGLLIGESALASYVGASGGLHGLAAWSAVQSYRRGCDLASWFLGGLILKLVWEQACGPTLGVALWLHGPVVVQAHLYGAIGGLLWALYEGRVHRSHS